jgi:hypothetical protein
LGAEQNPAASCKAVLDDDDSAPSGTYFIIVDGTPTETYCDMARQHFCRA